MNDVAREAYNKVQVGQTGWMCHDPGNGVTLEAFQLVVRAADIMQDDELIRIRFMHKESTSGGDLIDAIQFVKVR